MSALDEQIADLEHRALNAATVEGSAALMGQLNRLYVRKHGPSWRLPKGKPKLTKAGRTRRRNAAARDARAGRAVGEQGRGPTPAAALRAAEALDKLRLLLHEISGDLDARADNGDDLARDLGERLRAALRAALARSTQAPESPEPLPERSHSIEMP